VTEDDLSALPTMTKEDAIASFDEIVTERRLRRDLVDAHLETLHGDAYLLRRYHAVTTGGTSGRRGVFVYDWNGWIDAFFSLTRETLGEQIRDPSSAAARGPRVSITAGKPWHMGDALLRTFAAPQMPAIRLSVHQPIEQIAAALDEIQPGVLAAFPTVLSRLLAEAAAGRLRIAPRRVLSNSEPLTPALRAAVRDAWGAQVVNAYATSEGGGHAFSCPDGEGMHLAEDLCILEPVDALGRAVPPGVRCAKVLLTNLFNHAMPLIRYEIPDELVVMAEPCPCGSPRRRIADVQGRAADTFAYPGGVHVHPLAFLSPLDRHRAIIEFQVHQVDAGARVLVRTSQPIDLAPLRDDLAASLAAHGLDRAVISIEVVEAIERLPTGKTRRFVPLSL
jgi:phenylacetate-coenzyme A ligase PaaK-like adenylate-forming protein